MPIELPNESILLKPYYKTKKYHNFCSKTIWSSAVCRLSKIVDHCVAQFKLSPISSAYLLQIILRIFSTSALNSFNFLNQCFNVWSSFFTPPTAPSSSSSRDDAETDQNFIWPQWNIFCSDSMNRLAYQARHYVGGFQYCVYNFYVLFVYFFYYCLIQRRQRNSQNIYT